MEAVRSAGDGPALKYQATAGGKDYSADVQPGLRPGVFIVTLGDAQHTVEIEAAGAGWLFSLLVDGRSFEVAVSSGLFTIDGWDYAVEVERDLGFAQVHRSATDVADIKASIPGLVVAVHAQQGDEVREGQPLIVLEAMKMQMELKSPRTGHVSEIHVQPGEEVSQGQRLITVRD